MRWYSTSLIEPMLHFSSPKRSVKLKAQSKTGSANSNPTGESRPIAIFGFVPKAFPIVVMTVERLLPPTTDDETGVGQLCCAGQLTTNPHAKSIARSCCAYFKAVIGLVRLLRQPWLASNLCTRRLQPEILISQRIKFGHVPPDIRAWFKSVIAPNGVPCCDESDGHRTTYDVRAGAYWLILSR